LPKIRNNKVLTLSFLKVFLQRMLLKHYACNWTQITV
jgi:hypothetical protein